LDLIGASFTFPVANRRLGGKKEETSEQVVAKLKPRFFFKISKFFNL
jgi:hypothetical protein